VISVAEERWTRQSFDQVVNIHLLGAVDDLRTIGCQGHDGRRAALTRGIDVFIGPSIVVDLPQTGPQPARVDRVVSKAEKTRTTPVAPSLRDGISNETDHEPSTHTSDRNMVEPHDQLGRLEDRLGPAYVDALADPGIGREDRGEPSIPLWKGTEWVKATADTYHVVKVVDRDPERPTELTSERRLAAPAAPDDMDAECGRTGLERPI